MEPLTIETLRSLAGMHGLDRSDGELSELLPLVQAGHKLIRKELDAVLANVDVLVCATIPIARVGVGQQEVEINGEPRPVRPSLIRFTRPFNLTGHPAASVPCGFTPEGMPVGLQIIGRAFDEATVLRVADAYQRATDWHTRRPPLAA